MTMQEQAPTDQPFLDDRALAAVVYVLYLLALGTAFTALIGFSIAYMSRPASRANNSHPLHVPDTNRPHWVGIRDRWRHSYACLGWLSDPGVVVCLEPHP